MEKLSDSKLLHKPEPDSKSRLRRFLIIIGVLLAAGTLLAAGYRVFGFGIPCVFYQITGLYCPGCGTMRAVNALLQLDFAAALRYNALTVALLPLLAALLAVEAVHYLKGKRTRPGWEKWLCTALIVICILFAVLRNLPGFAFLQPAEPVVLAHLR